VRLTGDEEVAFVTLSNGILRTVAVVVSWTGMEKLLVRGGEELSVCLSVCLSALMEIAPMRRGGRDD